MHVKAIGEYEAILYSCRFCPMCKPAAEVGNLTQQEGHSTRGRAMLIWRVLKGYDRCDARAAELLFQSTLDGISEAWCINHFPVHEYVAAARRELFAQGLLPEPVRQTLSRRQPVTACARAETVLFAAEASELGDAQALRPLQQLCRAAGLEPSVHLAPSGMLAFALGDLETARQQAADVVGALKSAGARRVVCDGPQAMAALRVLYPALGLQPPKGLQLLGPAGLAEAALRQGRRRPAVGAGPVFVHDSRAAALLAEAPPDDAVLQPQFEAQEGYSGRGEVYDCPRRIVEALGCRRLASVWSRGLSRSAGSDDGLWLTYPALARGLASQRLAQLQGLGAEVVVSESLLEAHQLRQAGEGQPTRVAWLPELLAGTGA